MDSYWLFAMSCGPQKAQVCLRPALCGFLAAALSKFQLSILQIHQEENELVIKSVLKEAGLKDFELYDPFPSWQRRGHPLTTGSDKLIRVDAEEDQTDGFFLACFCRVQA